MLFLKKKVKIMLVTTNYAKKIMLAQSIKATQFSRPCRSDSPMGIPIPKTLVI